MATYLHKSRLPKWLPGSTNRLPDGWTEDKSAAVVTALALLVTSLVTSLTGQKPLPLQGG